MFSIVFLLTMVCRLSLKHLSPKRARYLKLDTEGADGVALRQAFWASEKESVAVDGSAEAYLSLLRRLERN